MPFNRLTLQVVLRAVRPMVANTGPPTFWRSPILRSIQKQSDLIRSFFQMEFTPINQGDTVQIVAVEGLTAKVIPRT